MKNLKLLNLMTWQWFCTLYKACNTIFKLLDFSIVMLWLSLDPLLLFEIIHDNKKSSNCYCHTDLIFSMKCNCICSIHIHKAYVHTEIKDWGKSFLFQYLGFQSLEFCIALHARWIVEMFDYLKQQNESIMNGFDKAGITEAKSANEVISRVENPFTEKRQNNK